MLGDWEDWDKWELRVQKPHKSQPVNVGKLGENIDGFLGFLCTGYPLDEMWVNSNRGRVIQSPERLSKENRDLSKHLRGRCSFLHRF